MRNYRSESIPEELVNRVEQLIHRLGTYRTVAEFVKEAVRLRLEALEKLQKAKEENILSGCPHSFGYLAIRPKDVPIPQECLFCPKLADCMVITVV